MGRKRQPRVAIVECATPAGYRWLRQHVRGATLTDAGFTVTNESEFAECLRAAGGREIAPANDTGP